MAVTSKTMKQEFKKMVFVADEQVISLSDQAQPIDSVLFVDSTVQDYQSLIKDVQAGTQVVILDANQDGVQQIANTLSQYSNLDSIQILSHGSQGQVNLGNATLNQSSLDNYQTAIQSWGDALSKTGDILFYGCNVAKGDIGHQFIHQLSLLTQADIAASNNVTGSAALGGDWVLEASTGEINSESVLSEEALKSYAFLLATNTLDFTGATVSAFVTATHSTTDFGTINFKVVSDVNSTGTANGSLSLATGGTIDVTFNDFYYNGTTDGEYLVIYTDGREVDFQSIKFGSSSGLTNGYTDLTFYAYKDNSLLGNQTITSAFPNADAASALVTLTDSVFENADEIRMIGTNTSGTFIDVAHIIIDDLIIADAISPNNAPTATNKTQTVNFTEDTTTAIADIVITDADSDTWTATVTMAANNSTLGSLSAASGNGETYTSGTGVWTITSATLSTVNAALAAMSFVPASNVSTNTTASVSISDGVAAAITGTLTLNGTAVNDAPTNGGTFPTDIAFTEDVAGNVDLSGMTLADVDVTDSIVVTLTATGGTMAATTGGGVTVGGSTTGTLTLTGTVANIDTYLNTTTNIKYTGAANANGADVETVAVKINDNAGSGDVALGTFNVDITAVNDAPTNGGTFPTDIAVTEDVAGNVDLSGMTLADVDSAGSVVVTLTATGGTLAATTGGSVTVGGSGTGTLTLTGTVTNIDTFLNTITNIKYTGAANANGADAETVAVKINDGDGSGDVALGTFNMDITAVNDAPTNGGTFPTDIAFTEDVAGNVDLSGMTLADVDVTDSIVVTLTATGGTMAATTGGSVTVGGSGTGTLTLTGTVANINIFLNTITNIKYTGAANANGADVETVAVKINDNAGSGDVALGTFNVDITAVNDAPTNGGTFPTDIAVTEDVAGNVDLSGMTLADVDSAGSVVVTLTATGGTLAATTGGSVTVGGSGTGTLTLTGTVANIDTFINTITNIKYTGAANANGADAETVAVKINDGDGSGDVALGTFNMDITAVNDAPTNGGTFPTDIAFTEDVAGNVDLSGMTLTDVDVTDSMIVTLTATGGTMTAATGGGVTVGGSGTGTLTLTGTVANIDTFLNTVTNIKYTGAANANGADVETVAVKINDSNGSGDVALGTFNADITAVNDVAVLNLDADNSSSAGGNNYAATFLAGGAAVKIADTDTSLTDVDDTNMESAVIALAGVLDGVDESISISGTPATMGGVTITYTSATQINLSGSASLADYQAVVEAIDYSNTVGTAGARTVTVKMNDGDADSNTATSTITVQALPTITSATYDASTGQLAITGTDFVAQAGATNDLIANQLTLTGEGGTYTLTDTANVEIASATAATLSLSTTDKLNINGLLNKNGAISSSATTYNLAGADGWMPQAPADESDLTGNAISVSNVATPIIVSAAYDAATHNLYVTGTNLFKKAGVNNDIDVSLFTLVGGNSQSYTLATTSDVEITSATSFTISVTGTDQSELYNIFDQLGTTSSFGATYDIQAADGWLTAADSAVNIADSNAEGGVSVVINPTISSATYNAGTGNLVVSGSNIQFNGGGADIDVSTLTVTGEGGATYTLTDSADVERDSISQFTVTLSATDKAAINQIVNRDGTSSTSATTYNLAVADDWNTNITLGDTSDTTGNGITASGVAAPVITSSTYDAATGVLLVTGTNFLKKSGAANDIDVSLFTFTGEGGDTYALTNSADAEITSGTAFSVTLSAIDKAALNQIVNKDGTTSTDATTYNLAAAEDWATGADAAVAVVDATGNGVTVSNVAAPTITSSTYNTGTGVLLVTGTGFLKKSGAANDIDASLFTLTGEGAGTYTLIGTADVEITSDTEFTITLDSTDKAAVNLLLEKNGTASTDATTYNLAAAEDWATGADAAVNVADTLASITVTIPAPVSSGGGGSTTTTTTTTTETVDGTDTSTTTETDGTTTTTIPVVEDTREEDPATISADHADIPVVTNADGDPILTVSIPTGVGLSVNGQPEAQSTQEAINDLIARIEQNTDENSDQREEITVQGQSFLASLTDDDTVVVQTITPTVPDGQVPDAPVIITASDSDDSKQALVIDVTNLPSGSVIQLDNVSFAVIVGAVRVVGGAGQNLAIGDHLNQFIVLGADDDILFGGSGDDTVGSLGGDDQTNGDAGNDIVYGGTANDIINGGAGNDYLNGGLGFDTAIQSGQQSDYQITVNGNDIVLTHSNGEIDTLTHAELIQFDSGSSLAIAYSDIEATAHHLAKTWLGRDLTSAEGSAVQNWQGAEVSDIIRAFHELPEAADQKDKTVDELLAGLDDNPNIIQLTVDRDLVAGDGDDQGYLSLGLARNVDGGTGHDVLQMLGGRSDVHLETVNGRLELTRLEDGAMLSLINAEAIAFDSAETVFIAHNEAEGILGRLFQSFYDRDATATEWQTKRADLAAGVDHNVMLGEFQQEANLSDLSDTEYVQAIYSQTLGRQATTTELIIHMSQLSNGQIDREWFAVEVASSDEAISVIGNVMLLDGWV